MLRTDCYGDGMGSGVGVLVTENKLKLVEGSKMIKNGYELGGCVKRFGKKKRWIKSCRYGIS